MVNVSLGALLPVRARDGSISYLSQDEQRNPGSGSAPNQVGTTDGFQEGLHCFCALNPVSSPSPSRAGWIGVPEESGSMNRCAEAVRQKHPA